MALKPKPELMSFDIWPDRAQDLHRAAQAGEAAREGHREDDRAAGAHARVAGGVQVEARGAELEALGGLEQEPGHDHGHEQRDDEAPVQPDRRQVEDQRDADEVRQDLGDRLRRCPAWRRKSERRPNRTICAAT